MRYFLFYAYPKGDPQQGEYSLITSGSTSLVELVGMAKDASKTFFELDHDLGYHFIVSSKSEILAVFRKGRRVSSKELNGLLKRPVTEMHHHRRLLGKPDNEHDERRRRRLSRKRARKGRRS